jgi:hypothetical protein
VITYDEVIPELKLLYLFAVPHSYYLPDKIW